MHADGVEGPVNPGNPSEITVGELAQTILDLAGSRSRIVSMLPPVDDPRVGVKERLLATIRCFESSLAPAAGSAS